MGPRFEGKVKEDGMSRLVHVDSEECNVRERKNSEKTPEVQGVS